MASVRCLVPGTHLAALVALSMLLDGLHEVSCCHAPYIVLFSHELTHRVKLIYRFHSATRA